MIKHIGTIIDKSYFEPYWVKETNNIHLYRICKICYEPIDLGFSKDENSGFACTLPHICDRFKEFNKMLKGTHTQLDLSKFIPELEWGQFIFIKAK